MPLTVDIVIAERIPVLRECLCMQLNGRTKMQTTGAVEVWGSIEWNDVADEGLQGERAYFDGHITIIILSSGSASCASASNHQTRPAKQTLHSHAAAVMLPQSRSRSIKAPALAGISTQIHMIPLETHKLVKDLRLRKTVRIRSSNHWIPAV